MQRYGKKIKYDNFSLINVSKRLRVYPTIYFFENVGYNIPILKINVYLCSEKAKLQTKKNDEKTNLYPIDCVAHDDDGSPRQWRRHLHKPRD